MNYKKRNRQIRTVLALVFFLMGCSAVAQTVKRHEVKAGETLYGISRAYGVSMSDLKAANPSIGTTESIMAGQVLVIPGKKNSSTNKGQVDTPVENVAADTPVGYKLVYKVKKKETLYSISKQFGVTVDELLAVNPSIKKDKLKKDTEIFIPYTQAELEAMKPQVVEEEIVIKEPVPVSVALIMPFGLNSEKKSKEAITMIDLYEGFMLALSELKKDGVSGSVYVYDEADIDSVLTLPKMRNLNLIVGAKEPQNIQKLINFTKNRGIDLVVPLSSQTSLVNNHPNVYQVNHKMDAETYIKAFGTFQSLHSSANLVFINIEDQTDQIEHVTRMKTFLNGEGVNYHSVGYSEMDSLVTLLSDKNENILITSSSTKTGFDRVVRKLEEMELADYDINLFGYPDWQAFANKEITAFSKYNCMFFSSFYNNPNSTASNAFVHKFRSAFGRDQYNTYPHYGMLGYDIANFFVMNKYVEGEDFAANIENLSSSPLQNPMHFTKKNSWSGYVNNALMFVKYNSDGSISVRQL